MTHVRFKVSRKAVSFVVTHHNDRAQGKELATGGDTFSVETSHFELHDLSLYELHLVPLAYVGISDRSFNLTINTQDAELHDELIKSLSNVFMRTVPSTHYFEPDHPGITNYIKNLSTHSRRDCAYTIKQLENKLTDKELIYCGAGPSLKDNLDLLKQISNKRTAYIAAGGSALRILSDAGIRIDFALAFDPYQTEWEHIFKDIYRQWTRNTILVQYPYLEWKSQLVWQGPRCIIGWLDPNNETTIDGLPSIESGGKSVSTFAPVLAQYMNCKALTLVGVDLCYKNGKYYADGEDYQPKIGMINHEGVVTTKALLRESQLISQVPTTMPTYNASNGIRIEGYEVADIRRLANKRHRHSPLQLPESTDIDWDVIDNNLKQIHQDCDAYNKDTLLYKSLLKSYDLIFSLREIWTGKYEKHILDALIKEIKSTCAASIKPR